MNIEMFEPGNLIFAAKDIVNDGSVPQMEENQLLAKAGQRGVIVNTGYLEEQPNRYLVLVQFENNGSLADLGPAVACWPDELSLPEDE